MKRTIILLTFSCIFLLGNAQERKIDSVVHVYLGKFCIDAIKSYSQFKFPLCDTLWLEPVFSGYYFKSDSSKKIETHEHIEYLSYINEYGDIVLKKKKIDYVLVDVFFGKISKNELMEILLSDFEIIDGKTSINLNKEFILCLSKKTDFIKFPTFGNDWKLQLKYEIEQLELGDKVIISDLNYDKIDSREKEYLYTSGYWVIK